VPEYDVVSYVEIWCFMSEKKLSSRQQKILTFINYHIGEKGYPPTIREIGEECNISSTSVVNYNLNKLEREGMLVRDRKVSRGLTLVNDPDAQDENSELVSVPLVGRIVASEPVPVPGSDFATFSEDDAIQIARGFVKNPEELFALQVKGDSMIDDLIDDGDVVIMRPHKDVKDGDMVAVWLDDREETTLKRIYREGDRIRLQPANPNMQAIFIDDPKTVNVQGRVVAVIRKM